ncbi:hypothetical protein [uncultured Lacinutrix sp.]|uniref:hypothetical protein n=1 Tax=uncultured Lacinutrix sp. TaxID=574032 RepID=UPI00261335A8|nr:hypothetical protein [uncultured Lacinutrix sp.]
MTEDEVDIWNSIIEDSKKKSFFKKVKWRKKDKIKFYQDTINRLLKEHQQDIFINRCSICGALARTPEAKICRNSHKKVNDVWVEMNSIK